MAIIEINFLAAFSYRVLIVCSSAVAYCGYLWRQGRSEGKNLQLHNQYIFLFPVFREQNIILETLKYYEKFLAWFPGVQLFFVTTAKEKGKSTTEDIIRQFIAKSVYKSRISCICCPEEQGTKATQINYAVDYIRSSTTAMPYIVSFDCDARISWQDFLLADSYTQAHSQHMVYSFLPKSKVDDIHNPMIKAAALHHGERMLAFEYFSSLQSLGLHYPMGATLIFSPQLWKHLAHIPEPNDDLALKYILDSKHLSYVSLPYFTHVQAPPNSKNLYRQMIPVFNGVFSYFKTLRLHSGHALKQYQLPFIIKQIAVGLGWYAFYALEYLSIVLLSFALIKGDTFFILFFFLQIVLDLLFLKQLSFLNFWLHFLGYFIRLSQFSYFLFYQLFGGPALCQFKTERTVSKIKEECVTMT